jgi:hypothetical protein
METIVVILSLSSDFCLTKGADSGRYAECCGLVNNECD